MTTRITFLLWALLCSSAANVFAARPNVILNHDGRQVIAFDRKGGRMQRKQRFGWILGAQWNCRNYVRLPAIQCD